MASMASCYASTFFIETYCEDNGNQIDTIAKGSRKHHVVAVTNGKTIPYSVEVVSVLPDGNATAEFLQPNGPAIEWTLTVQSLLKDQYYNGKSELNCFPNPNNSSLRIHASKFRYKLPTASKPIETALSLGIDLLII